MDYSEFETIKHFNKQIGDFKSLIKLVALAPSSMLDKNKLQELKRQVLMIEQQLEDIKYTISSFNQTFSNRGWIAYDHLDNNLMKSMIEISKNESIDKAELKMLEYMRPENLDIEWKRLKSVPELKRREQLIDFVKKDYIAERYYSVIPLLLMIIDGTVNDIINKGFHAKINLDVWNSITNADGGIYTIQGIFQKGRQTTRDEKIDMPYRNGILHGMDLGYANYTVAAKCWHFLFVVRDWAKSKQSETRRKENFEKEKNVPSIPESLKKIQYVNQQKKALAEWKPRKITKQYLHDINLGKLECLEQQEQKLLQFCELWKKKNYGYMAKMYWSPYFYENNQQILEVKNQFKVLPLESFQIKSIIDSAPAMIDYVLNCHLINADSQDFEIRMIYEDENSKFLASNFAGGIWKIHSVVKK